MGPHPGRKKLVVRTFEKKTGRYSEKTAAKVELKQHQPAVIYAALKAKPKIRVPGPGVDRKPGLSVAEQRQRKRARLAALAWLKAAYPA